MSSTKPNALPLSTKHQFEVLDGLRGLAALAVVIFHFMEFITPDYQDNFIAHAYLAVDFFFCLSGFVMAHAYDHKLATLGVGPFLKRRLIRLHPLVVIGSLIGLAAFVFDPYSKLYASYGQKAVVLFITSCLMIPYPLIRERYYNLFHLNPPTWSLFWEYIANLLYALVLVRLRPKALWLITIMAALLLIYEAHRSTYLGVGFGGDNIMGGGIRALFSFLAGLLVYRSGWLINTRLGFASVGFMLLLTFLIPFRKSINWFIDPAVVIVYFPFLIGLGAGAHPKGVWLKTCQFSGALSYPLYMIHYPFLWIVLSYIEVRKPTIDQLVVITLAGTVLLLILAYLILRYVDEPIRRYLKKRLEKPA